MRVRKDLCVGCGLCTESCPRGAISLQFGQARIYQERCNHCGFCLDACPQGAIVELVYGGGKVPKPAILFDEIPGYPKGYRTLFGMLGSTWRIAKTMGLPEDRVDPMGVADNWYKKTKDYKERNSKGRASCIIFQNS